MDTTNSNSSKDQVVINFNERSALIESYIQSNMIGERIQITRVLYMGGRVWYWAEPKDPINDGCWYHLCHFGHTKPSAVALEKYLWYNSASNEDGKTLEVISTSNPSDLPSTSVPIREAIEVTRAFKVTSMTSLNGIIDQIESLYHTNELKEELKMHQLQLEHNRDLSNSLFNPYHSGNVNSKAADILDIYVKEFYDRITKEISYSKGSIYINREYKDILYYRNKNNALDENYLKALNNSMDNNRGNNGRPLVGHRYYYLPSFTYYCSTDYKKELLKLLNRIANSSSKKKRPIDNKKKIHEIFLMRHCIRLGLVPKMCIILAPSFSHRLKLPQVPSLNRTANNESDEECRYSACNNTIEVNSNGEHVQCSLRSGFIEAKELTISTNFINPNTNDYPRDTITNNPNYCVGISISKEVQDCGDYYDRYDTSNDRSWSKHIIDKINKLEASISKDNKESE